MIEGRFSIGQAAGLAGMAEKALRNILTGRNRPRLDNLVAIALALGVEPGDLFLEPAALEKKVSRDGLKPPFVVMASSPASFRSSRASSSLDGSKLAKLSQVA